MLTSENSSALRMHPTPYPLSWASLIMYLSRFDFLAPPPTTLAVNGLGYWPLSTSRCAWPWHSSALCIITRDIPRVAFLRAEAMEGWFWNVDTWLLRGGHTATLNVQVTRDGTLAQRLRGKTKNIGNTRLWLEAKLAPWITPS